MRQRETNHDVSSNKTTGKYQGRTLVAQGGTFIHGNVVRSLHHVEKQRAERHLSKTKGVG
jgi:hypothetical protein